MITSAFVLFAVIKVAYSDEEVLIPKHCWGPPEGIDPHVCCRMHGFFNLTEFQQCGVTNFDPQRRLDRNDCYYPTCLLKNQRLLKGDNTPDYNKLIGYLNSWASFSSHLVEATHIATKQCIREGGPPDFYGPLSIETRPNCALDKLFFCLKTYILWNCRLKESSSTCMRLKANMEECRPYLFPDIKHAF